MTRRLAVLLAVGLSAAACSIGGAGGSPSAAASPARSPVAPVSPSPSPFAASQALTLAGLFHPGTPPNYDPSRLRTLLVTGDVIPARSVQLETVRRGSDFLWPFRPTSDYVKSADITFTDLEAPLFSGCPLQAGDYTFCGDPRYVNGLVLDGVKVANLANNHLTNYGAEGVNATVKLLADHGIATCGAGTPAFLTVRGLKFAFLGFNGVGGPIDRDALRADVQFAKQNADVVVVQFHWGKEYQRLPVPDPGVPTPDDPVEIGHIAIDAGADFVVGNHPHWVQGVEVYKGHLITYAHGNFIFDQMWSEETREGVIGTYTFYDKTLVSATWKPVRIYDYGQPQFMDANGSARVLGEMALASDQLAAKLGEPAGAQ